MSKVFEYESDCPPVEKIMWGKVLRPVVISRV